MQPRPRSVSSFRGVKRFAALFVSLALIGAACSNDEPADGGGALEAGDGDFGATSDELNTIAIAERFGNSTAALSVVVQGQQMLPDFPDGLPDDVEVPDGVIPRVDAPIMRSSGSGFVIESNDNRFVVTNFHVVMDTLPPGSTEMFEGSTITATFGQNEFDQFPLRVIGVNPSFDLALLEPLDDSTPLPDVDPIPLADSDLVLKGQKTIAMGNPFGLGTTLTTGTVSSTGRFVQSVGQVSIPMIQTDAAINPGNSGGALFNSSGELIGVNTAIFNPEAAAFAGIGFAVPSNLVQEALANLELGGVSNLNDTRPAFGAQLGTLALLPEQVREAAGLPESGVVILDVAPGGAAENAGLSAPEFESVMGISVPVDADVIVAIDGATVATAEDLNLAITYDAELGQEVTLTILRGGAETEVVVSLDG